MHLCVARMESGRCGWFPGRYEAGYSRQDSGGNRCRDDRPATIAAANVALKMAGRCDGIAVAGKSSGCLPGSRWLRRLHRVKLPTHRRGCRVQQSPLLLCGDRPPTSFRSSGFLIRGQSSRQVRPSARDNSPSSMLIVRPLAPSDCRWRTYSRIRSSVKAGSTVLPRSRSYNLSYVPNAGGLLLCR